MHFSCRGNLMVHSALKEFGFLEHYAGRGVMTDEIKTMYETTTAKLDIELHRGMNILSPAGFAFETENLYSS